MHGQLNVKFVKNLGHANRWVIIKQKAYVGKFNPAMYAELVEWLCWKGCSIKSLCLIMQ